MHLPLLDSSTQLAEALKSSAWNSLRNDVEKIARFEGGKATDYIPHWPFHCRIKQFESSEAANRLITSLLTVQKTVSSRLSKMALPEYNEILGKLIKRCVFFSGSASCCITFWLICSCNCKKLL